MTDPWTLTAHPHPPRPAGTVAAVGKGWTVADEGAKFIVMFQARHYRCTCRKFNCPHILAVLKWRTKNPIGATNGSGVSGLPGTSPSEDRPADNSVNGMFPPEGGRPDTLHAPGPVGGSPAPDDPRFGPVPLPEWLTAFRPHQWAAVEEAMEVYDSGAKVVWLDAPTGAGKTIIAELIRRMARTKALYVCSTKSLQAQFLHDFPYAHVLKGRANYPTMDHPFPNVTCGDCTKVGNDGTCHWCDRTDLCPYRRAKASALRSEIAVLNTAYLMAEANNAGRFAGRGLSIMDECDMLERELMSFVEFNMGFRQLEQLGVSAPKKGSHTKTIMSWIGDDLRPAALRKLVELRSVSSLWGDVKHVRKVQAAERAVQAIDQILKVAGADETGEGWVRDNDAGPMVLKPITVNAFGGEVLWSHADKWLCMSATIISSDQMSDALGLTPEIGGHRTVTVPMTFPVEHRPIYQCPVATMTAKDKATAWPQMVKGIVKVLERHRDERVLVHAVSYALANEIVKGLQAAGLNRDIVTYRTPTDRDDAVARYRRTPGAVIVAPSLDRGVDLKGDDCRVVIVAKVPFPYLGDPQVSKRMHMPGGKQWYAVQTVRTIVQMTGRGVRSKDDWCATYVLDSQFGSNIYKRHKRLFPEWWREAVEFMPRRDLMEVK